MDILKAIETLEFQNQKLVDKYGANDLSRLNDDVRNSIIDFYMISKDYEKQNITLSLEYSKILNELDKYKSFLRCFETDLKEIDNIPYEVIKTIERENFVKKWGFFTIDLFRIQVENCYMAIRFVLRTVEIYYYLLGYPEVKEKHRQDFPEFSDWFDAIDNDPFDFQNIKYSVYKESLSRLHYTGENISNPNTKINMSIKQWHSILDRIGHLRKSNND